MDIYIIRNAQRYGPYSENDLLTYVNDGQVLVHDKAVANGDSAERTVGFYLKKAGMKWRIPNKGNIFSQLFTLGSEVIFPISESQLFKFLRHDKRSLILVVVGLIPMLIMNIPFTGFMLFYEVALYFSIIWGLFFYTCFRTPQVGLKPTVLTFFLEQVLVFVLWDITGLPNVNPFYAFVAQSFPVNIVGFVLGVGLTEEFVKLLPLLLVLKWAKEPLIPQTLVFYGLMSGIAFGVYEGVQYQMTVNAQQDYDVSFFLNIARLTSLPFLHACWCGIAGYFLSFAHLYPKYRRGLYTIAIAVPAVLHGLYDSLCGFWGVSLVIVFLVLMLLLIYLNQMKNTQSKLSQ